MPSQKWDNYNTLSKAQGTFWKENQKNPKETEEVGGKWRTDFWE